MNYKRKRPRRYPLHKGSSWEGRVTGNSPPIQQHATRERESNPHVANEFFEGVESDEVDATVPWWLPAERRALLGIEDVEWSER